MIYNTNLKKICSNHYHRVCSDSKVRTKGLISILEIKCSEAFGQEKAFYKLLIDDLDLSNGETLISGSPKYLKSKIDEYTLKFGDILTETFKEELLKRVFFYSSYEKWGAYKLAKELKVNVCPYCNRQYTFTIMNNGQTRPQYDHFYDKVTYPYLSLSFFNLIPSCSICNTDLKTTSKFCITSHVNPYIEDFNDVISFSITPNNIDFIDGKSSAYRIKFKANPLSDISKVKRAMRNVVAFRLRILYNQHKDYVDELIIKSRIYNEDYILALYDQFKGELFSDVNDVKRLIVSNYITQNELGNRVLAKMTADISKELGLI